PLVGKTWGRAGIDARMIVYILRRFFGFAATLLVAALVIFLLLDLLPGDPAQFILGLNATPESVARLRVQMGLDVPAPQRFAGWIWGMLQGDFGMSYTQRAPVAQLIWDRLGVTVPLSLFAMLISMVVGLPLGILAARRQSRALVSAIMVLAQSGVAVPSFWCASSLALLFAVTLGCLPSCCVTPCHHGAGAALCSPVLPSLGLALPQASILARAMRTA